MCSTPTPRVRKRTFSSHNPSVSRDPRQMSRLAVEYVLVSQLKPATTKLRKRQQRQIEHLTESLRKFGCVVPILVDGNSEVIAGEAVLEAAKQLGLVEVPVSKIEYLSAPEIRALRIALNKLATLSSWDENVLKTELEFLSSVDFELPSFTGFSSYEIDVLISSPTCEPDDLERGDEVPPEQVVSRPGDVWMFRGGHKLGCLDAIVEASFDTLMGDEQAGLTISDAPFNVRIRGHVTGRAGAREFSMASGEMSSDAFTEFLAASFRHSAAYSREGSLSLQFMDWRHVVESMAAGRAVYGELFNLAVWAKTNPGMGTPWRSGHELCFVWKKGAVAHVDNVRLGRHGRNRSNVWSYPGANQQRDAGSEGHVTPKNLAMIQDAILDVSNRGDIVLDAFAGSGTTLVAAHLTRRRGYGLEIDPAYVDLAVRRMEARTKAPARHLETGLTFSEVAAERLAPPTSPLASR